MLGAFEPGKKGFCKGLTRIKSCGPGPYEWEATFSHTRYWLTTQADTKEFRKRCEAFLPRYLLSKNRANNCQKNRKKTDASVII
jgi:hypothetical protein